MADEVQKVTAIIRSGTVYGSINVQSHYGFTAAQSRLAGELAPPPKPPGPTTRFWTSWRAGVLIGGWVLGAIMGGIFEALGPVGGVLGGIMGFIGIIATIVFIGYHLNILEKEAKAAIPVWEAQLERYDKLYYCSRDDGVFIPGEGKFVPLSQWQTIL
jgi:hypothetical protein